MISKFKLSEATRTVVLYYLEWTHKQSVCDLHKEDWDRIEDCAKRLYDATEKCLNEGD